MDDMFRKIQGLLAKAEGTDNQHEADAFMSKAQELMIRYAIDEARVRESLGASKAAEQPIMVEFEYSSTDGNAAGKKTLLHLIARANRVRMLDHTNRRGSNAHKGSKTTSNQFCSLVGYASDIEMVKLLYASLFVQATRFSIGDWRERSERYGISKGRSKWFTSYLVGFAETIYRRMGEVQRQQTTAETSALILRTDRSVDEAFARFFPHTRTKTSRMGDASGRAQGALSGARADIGTTGLTAGARRLSAGGR